MIEFVVHGVPIPQGSKTPWGSEANPHLKPWRLALASIAAEQNGAVMDEPVVVTATFVFPRPKSHYRTGKFSDELKDSAPVYHTSAPDLDKLCRAVGDALKSVVVRDDRLIACWYAKKLYGLRPHARIQVTALTGVEEAR